MVKYHNLYIHLVDVSRDPERIDYYNTETLLLVVVVVSSEAIYTHSSSRATRGKAKAGGARRKLVGIASWSWDDEKTCRQQ